MKKGKQADFIKRVRQQFHAQKKEEDADGITHEIDAKRYTCEERLTKEKEVTHKKYPLAIGPSQQLKKTGDYFLFDTTDIPILTIKGRDEKIRAFLNICRHRWVRLLVKKCSQAYVVRN